MEMAAIDSASVKAVSDNTHASAMQTMGTMMIAAVDASALVKAQTIRFT
jgi:hypothetical protein